MKLLFLLLLIGIAFADNVTQIITNSTFTVNPYQCLFFVANNTNATPATINFTVCGSFSKLNKTASLGNGGSDTQVDFNYTATCTAPAPSCGTITCPTCPAATCPSQPPISITCPTCPNASCPSQFRLNEQRSLNYEEKYYLEPVNLTLFGPKAPSNQSYLRFQQINVEGRAWCVEGTENMTFAALRCSNDSLREFNTSINECRKDLLVTKEAKQKCDEFSADRRAVAQESLFFPAMLLLAMAGLVINKLGLIERMKPPKRGEHQPLIQMHIKPEGK